MGDNKFSETIREGANREKTKKPPETLEICNTFGPITCVIFVFAKKKQQKTKKNSFLGSRICRILLKLTVNFIASKNKARNDVNFQFTGKNSVPKTCSYKCRPVRPKIQN